MRIVLDAMGGDYAPAAVVDGGVQAAREFGVEVVLAGRREAIEPELAKHDTAGLQLPIVHASQVIEMDEHPALVAKAKRDSSMVVGMQLVRQGEADAFVTMGNSGGALAVALFHLGRLKGIKRPALSSVFPTVKGPAFLIDLGANADCKPEYLLQFAVMGSVYAERVLGIANPRVGLVSNGEEEGKGNSLVQETTPLLKASGLNFVGNVEGKDVPAGLADVIVTDGFTGNVIVKISEGVAAMILEVLEREIKARPVAMAGALLAKPAFRAVKRALDYSEYGGAALLGVNGIVIVGHGRSNAKAVKSALRVAKVAIESKVLDAIRSGVQAAGGAAEEEGN
ncbi:MAG TPA: phosphate acyltransferase PlsX [Anaerolineae bacterium]|nr:phosphate acyltransferase PlsX [Anaerolineae bacterium]HOQ97522.1 phosphate acyltransferase PlsX [Anaerolineae bacterium]HPL27507.1 phosphate acyltransferase PlsX [Anaerolineae bacterium]